MTGQLFSLRLIKYCFSFFFFVFGCAELDIPDETKNVLSKTAGTDNSGDSDTINEPSTDSTTDTFGVDDTNSSDDTLTEDSTDNEYGSDADTDTDTDTDTDMDTDGDIETDPDTSGTADSDSESDDTAPDTQVETDDTEECSGSVCLDSDGCCPYGCTLENDNDCFMKFPYTPSNFTPASLKPNTAPASITLDCNAILDSSGTPSFTEWCGQPTPPVVVDNEVVVVTFVNFTISASGSLRVIGERPVVMAVFGDANIQGVIDASAQVGTPGAGGNISCNGSRGGAGYGFSSTGGSGGGGGGFGTDGGKGGLHNLVVGGVGGATRGTASLVPLVGGCPGGPGGGCSSNGSAGGGAVQLSSAGALNLTGTIKANGGVGVIGCGLEGGGGGGGSGGAILLEGAPTKTTSGTLQVNGGNGGDGKIGGSGGPGSTSSSASGGTGASEFYTGAGGGGGGYGRIRINTH